MADAPAVKNFFERTRAAKKIVVVDFGFLGDSIHLIPALWEIKRHYPEAQLHTLSAPVGAEALGLAPCVDRAWSFPLTTKSPAWWRHWGILIELRREQFDIAFNFSGSDRSIFSMWLIGARSNLTHLAGRKHFWTRGISGDCVERANENLPEFERRRQVLAAAGFSLEAPRFDLRVPEDARQWAAEEIAAQPVHFSVSASRTDKEWPLENWIGLARLLTKKSAPIPIVASAGPNPREQERVRELARAAGGAVRAFEGLSIARLAALLQRCRLQVGADSGVLHLAMALDLPTLAVFRQSAGLAQWLPTGEKHRHLVVPCPCLERGHPDCLAAGRSACLAGITPEQVFEKFCQQLR